MESMKFEPVNDELLDSESEDSLEEHGKKIVLGENLEKRDQKAYEKELEAKNGFFENQWKYTTNAENAFGAFIQKGLQEGFKSALSQCGVMVCLSFTIQFVITYELYLVLPNLDDAEAIGHCTNPSSLQTASLAVWFLMMVKSHTKNYFLA